MKLSEATYFPDAKELTRHGFVSHMEDFIGKLIGDSPLSADVDDYLKGFDIDSKKALEMLTKPEIDGVPESAVVMRTERIKNGGTDEFGKPMKDEFQVIYKVPKKDMANGIKGIDEKLRNLYIKLFENHIVEGTVLNEDDGGDGGAFGDMGENGGSSTFSLGAGGSYPYFDANALGKKKSGKQDEEKSTDFPIMRRGIYKVTESKKMKRPIGRMTMYITEEQMKQLAQLIKEDEFGGGALTTSNVGVDGPNDWQYDVPFGAESKDDPAMDHSNLFDWDDENNKPTGHDGRHSQNESKSGIHIDPENKGKFTATKKRTGKSTEELTHSKNPLTRKRAQFALNAKKWSHKKKND